MKQGKDANYSHGSWQVASGQQEHMVCLHICSSLWEDDGSHDKFGCLVEWSAPNDPTAGVCQCHDRGAHHQGQRSRDGHSHVGGRLWQVSSLLFESCTEWISRAWLAWWKGRPNNSYLWISECLQRAIALGCSKKSLCSSTCTQL